jgi:hypothetical protein
MCPIIRILFIAVATVTFLVVAYIGCRLVSSWQKHYEWQEMDWNSDGVTSFSEFIEASDVGGRDVVRGRKTCREYFSVKDGLPIRTDCPR